MKLKIAAMVLTLSLSQFSQAGFDRIRRGDLGEVQGPLARFDRRDVQQVIH